MASACRDSALKGFVLQELNCCLEWFIRAYHNANRALQGNIGETVCELCKPPYTARMNVVSHLPTGASGEATRSRCLHGLAEELTHRCKSTVLQCSGSGWGRRGWKEYCRVFKTNLQ